MPAKLPPTLEWKKGAVRLIDQTLLPEVCRMIDIKTPPQMVDAIRRLAVRGAPAIGCAAAYGVVLGANASKATTSAALIRDVEKTARLIASSRPTAVNLFWACERMADCARKNAGAAIADLKKILLAEADAIYTEDQAMCRAIGKNGAALVKPKKGETWGILTHCNAGALATAGMGTALAVIYAAHDEGKKVAVFSDETRPLCQGSRLTAWELSRSGLPVTVICDNMAAQVMREGRVKMVVVGADRIAANGDTANKIGTYGVAILAKYHHIPFYVAAPASTFDLTLPDGNAIPIEQRSADEIRKGFGRLTAPKEAAVYNPAFDVTPANLIAGIITDRGVIANPTTAKVARHFRGRP